MTENMESDRQRVDTSDYSCQLGADGIIRLSLLRSVDVDLELAEAAVQSFRDIAGGRPHPALVHVGMAQSMTHKARRYLASVQGPAAVGMVVTSPIARVIGSVFMGLLKESSYPARVFATEEAALEWLRQYVEPPS